MLRTQLALLANLLGGYAKTAKALDVPQHSLEDYVNGEMITKRAVSVLNRQYNDLRLNDAFWDRIDRGYDLEETPYDSIADYLDDLEENELDWERSDSLLKNFDTRLRGKFLDSVAKGQIDLEDIENDESMNKGHIDFFRELTPRQTQLILERLNENSRRSLKAAIEGYIEDDGDIYDDVETSAFWEWYRDTFYN